MRFKFKDIRKAIEHLKYQCSVEDECEIELKLNEEDIGNDKLGSSFEIIAKYVKEAATYDSCKSSRFISVSTELFTISENRPMRSIKTETVDIED